MALWCAIRTFAEHAAELGNEQPPEPVFFVKPNNCIQRSGPIKVSNHPGSVHHEVECVIKLDGNLQPEAIAVGLDLTDRETQSQLRAEQLPWSKGKCFVGSGVIGGFQDYSGTSDSLCNGNFLVKLTVNGEIRQLANLSEMSITPSQQLDSLTTWAPVVAGDYLFTGTPSGVAELFPGDRVRATLESNDGKVISEINTVCE
ncbi:MAG: fumarylacetoacetate hydrolase family protein [Candidatus Poseidoniaceae archaeon]|nr:fumarylacetoacetate hydrolase family protein [Candidatus Poseidoniaceae archaeon]